MIYKISPDPSLLKRGIPPFGKACLPVGRGRSLRLATEVRGPLVKAFSYHE